MMSHHHQDPYRPSFDGGGDSSGPEKLSSNVYSGAIVSGGAPVVRSLQPFDISINSPGGMATSLGYPFTWAQWKELEMQAIIYKYLVSAISVPPDLLLSICTNSSGASYTNTQGQRYTNIRDLEPGRCKRTDGKKWRCSRYVAPNQKYCERHMHRGRPRSRKHVEVHGDVNNKKARLQPAPLESTPVIVPIPKPAGQIINSPSTKQTSTSTFQQIQGPLFCHDKIGENISSDPFFNELHRNSGWMMEGELVAKADAGQQWQHLIDSNSGFSADVRVHPDLQHGYREESLNLLACRDLERTGEDASVKHNGEFNFMINPELVSMGKQSVKETPRELINAWSSLWPSQGNISPSSLTLSIAMAAGDALDEDMGFDSRFMNANQHKFWEKGWVPFASGGPLAELLHPSSSYTSNGDSN